MHQLKNEKKYIEQAFRFFEKNKYLLLLEKLKMAEAANKTGIPDSLLEMERKLNVELKLAQDKLDDEQNNKRADNSKVLSLNAKVFKIVREIENMGTVFEKNYPNYFKVKYLETSIQLENLQVLAQQKEMNIIQYFWGTSSIYVISTSRDDVKFTKIKNNPEFGDNLNNFIALLQSPNVTSPEKFRAYSNVSHNLYEQVLQPALEPIMNNNKQIKNLTVIPDGLLTKLSFEVLTTSHFKATGIDYKNLPYLVYQFNIQYAYSSSILLDNSKADRSRNVNKLLGFSYSDLTRLPDPSYNALPGTATEMEVIRNYFRAQEYLGQNATKNNFIKNVADYDIIHLALHGTADEKNETDTKLIFRKGKDSENGLLNANEIYGLKLKAKLVVLSACETGIGKNYKGEGVFSVARAFSYAGCPSVVISLWKVNDQSTSDIMGNFYKFLSQGDGIGYSLYEAKLEFLKNADEYSAHPAYWSSFVAFGDMSPLKSRKDLKIWFIIIFITIGFTLTWRYRFLTRRHSKQFQNK
jgi:CHAT domain-containing protein